MAQLEKLKLSETPSVTPVAARPHVLDFSAPAQNDNEVNDIADDKVLKAARLLVARHTPQAPVELSAFDTPHNALVEISEKLEEMGVSHAISEPLIESLKGYVLENGGSFARAANAKPISVYMVVRDTLPPRRFNNSVTEVAFIGRKSAKVEGVSSINVRLTVSGTAMTSNAADVDKMFANVNETGLWLRFEAPTKEDLEGMMSAMEIGLASAVQAVGGAMDASDLKALLETLQKDDVLLPQVEKLIVNLITVQDILNGKGDMPAVGISALVAEIGSVLSNPDYIDLMPPAFVQAALDTMQSLSTSPNMADIMIESGFGHLVEAEQERQQGIVIESALETLGEVLRTEDLDPEVAKTIDTLIAEASASIEGGKTPNADILEAIKAGAENIASMENLPPQITGVLEGIVADIEIVMPTTQSDLGFATDLSVQSTALMDIISEVAAKIESGELTQADLPQDAAELFEKIVALKAIEKEIGPEAMQAEIIKILEGKADPDLSAKVESVVLMLAKPDIQAALPADLSHNVQSFVREYPTIIEAVATQSVIREIAEQIKTAPAGSPEAEQLKAVMEAIKTDGLSAVVLSVEGQNLLPQFAQALIKQNPSIIEAVAAQTIVRDLAEQIKALPAGSPEAEQIKTAIQTIKAEGLSEVVLSVGGQSALPPSVQSLIKNSPSIIEAVATQSVVRELAEQVKAAPAGSPDAEQLRATIQAIKTDGLSAVVLSAEGQSVLPASVQSFVKDNPSIIEAVATQSAVRELMEQIKAVPAGSSEAEHLRASIEIVKAEGLSVFVKSPEGQAPLPLTVQVLLKENPLVGEAIVGSAMIRDLMAQVQSLPPTSAKANASEERRYEKLSQPEAQKPVVQNVLLNTAGHSPSNAGITSGPSAVLDGGSSGATRTPNVSGAGMTSSLSIAAVVSGGVASSTPKVNASSSQNVTSSNVVTPAKTELPAMKDRGTKADIPSIENGSTHVDNRADFEKKNRVQNKQDPEGKPPNPDVRKSCGSLCKCHETAAAKSGTYVKDGDNIIVKNNDGTTQALTKAQASERITNEIATEHKIPRQNLEDLIKKLGDDPLKLKTHVDLHMKDYAEQRVKSAVMASKTTSNSDLMAGLTSFGAENSTGGLTGCFAGCACNKHGNSPVNAGISIPSGSSLDSLGSFLEGPNDALSGGTAAFDIDLSAAEKDESTQKLNNSFAFADFKMI